VAGLAAAFGSGAMTNSINELQHAKVIFIIGSNTTEAHPIISNCIKRAVKRGAILIVNDPRAIDLTHWATLHVRHKVGTDIAYLNGLMNELFKNGWAREDYLRDHTENPDGIREWVKDYPVETASEICGVPVETMKKVAKILGEAESASVCYTLGITEHICGTDNVKTLANLQMVLGNVGKPAGGVNPLRGQNNVQGACDMGVLPNVFHNYQGVSDKAVSEKIAKAWGLAQLPQKPGYTMPTMLRKALDGGTKILYCVGDNTVQSEPNMAHTVKEIEALELFIVCDIFPNMTTPYAHVLFPDTCWGEEDGTFTNTERRVSRVRQVLIPPGEARSHWWVLQELGKRLGKELGFSSANAVWEDMRKSATSYAGITWERIDKIGLQWPCPTLEHPGTPILHRGGQFTRGKGLFAHTEWTPPAEPPDEEYPFILSTGRRLWHYHTGTQTRNSVGFDKIFGEELLEIHPDDAQKLGIQSGDLVQATSRRGSIILKAWVTERSTPGLAWCAFHFAEACANALTLDRYDPETETPEFKACAIKIKKIAERTGPLGTGMRRQARP
jgi:formate dehydrogenase major subunit